MNITRLLDWLPCSNKRLHVHLHCDIVNKWCRRKWFKREIVTKAFCNVFDLQVWHLNFFLPIRNLKILYAACSKFKWCFIFLPVKIITWTLSCIKPMFLPTRLTCLLIALSHHWPWLLVEVMWSSPTFLLRGVLTLRRWMMKATPPWWRPVEKGMKRWSLYYLLMVCFIFISHHANRTWRVTNFQTTDFWLCIAQLQYKEVFCSSVSLALSRVSSVMEKSWNSGKWQNHFPDLEKSWNLIKRPKSWKNHGISKCIMEKSWNLVFEIFSHTTFDIFSARHARNWSFSFRIDHGKCYENHGKFMEKIMEFYFGKWLETLTQAIAKLWEGRAFVCNKVLVIGDDQYKKHGKKYSLFKPKCPSIYLSVTGEHFMAVSVI